MIAIKEEDARARPLGMIEAARTPRSPLEGAHDPYFVQKVVVGRELAGRSRLDVFRQICQGRRVLHVGCVDWPITDPANSLHVHLDKHCHQLDGLDIHPEAFPAIQPYVSGRLYNDWQQVDAAYDLILAPEVLEHVADIGAFLASLDKVDAPDVVITVPDAFSCMKRHFDYLPESETFVEVVHPDHNCWYTPYTFSNVIRKYTNWSIQGLWFFNNISLLAILHKPEK